MKDGTRWRASVLRDDVERADRIAKLLLERQAGRQREEERKEGASDRERKRMAAVLEADRSAQSRVGEFPDSDAER